MILSFFHGVSRRRTDTADVAELVDALDLGSSIERCESSSLSVRTITYVSPLALSYEKPMRYL